jgi:flagellar basal-body rod protein FlgC
MIDILTGIRSTASALNAERVRMDVISQNIAHVNNTARGPDGLPYQRKQVVFETQLQDRLRAGVSGSQPAGLFVSRVVNDPSPSPQVYNPSHPDADANGYVAMPNVSLHREMVDLIAASRAFEANLAVMKHSRSMAAQTLAIGKR